MPLQRNYRQTAEQPFRPSLRHQLSTMPTYSSTQTAWCITPRTVFARIHCSWYLSHKQIQVVLLYHSMFSGINAAFGSKLAFQTNSSKTSERHQNHRCNLKVISVIALNRGYVEKLNPTRSPDATRRDATPLSSTGAVEIEFIINSKINVFSKKCGACFMVGFCCCRWRKLPTNAWTVSLCLTERWFF